MIHPPRRWTEAEVAILLARVSAGVKHQAIGAELRRGVESISKKLHTLREPYRVIGTAGLVPKPVVSEQVLVERDQRYAAPHRSLTAAFFGDPPLGYSALDRRA